ncbi:hypothetical protein BCR35DRAFT_298907 [Leucosporidium creatinivorum]|uniref:Alpha-ketoglutarate-dependent dioxygenase AlkB-like domain-containing protein n=1 Tax=Leucosporidium creatinivorum TaxID=106004 RepID=A0A1Y2G2R2_9BASI|nr:hypothetical protein BCR35DRAFT_298907 [Leucosporidium creatinivorum]
MSAAAEPPEEASDDPLTYVELDAPQRLAPPLPPSAGRKSKGPLRPRKLPPLAAISEELYGRPRTRSSAPLPKEEERNWLLYEHGPATNSRKKKEKSPTSLLAADAPAPALSPELQAPPQLQDAPSTTVKRSKKHSSLSAVRPDFSARARTRASAPLPKELDDIKFQYELLHALERSTPRRSSTVQPETQSQAAAVVTASPELQARAQVAPSSRPPVKRSFSATPLDPAKRPRTRSSAPLSPEDDDNWRLYVSMTPSVQSRIKKRSVSEAVAAQGPLPAAQASPDREALAEHGPSQVSCGRLATEVVPALPTPPATPVVVAELAPSSNSTATHAQDSPRRLSAYEQLRAEIASRCKRTNKPSTKLKESWTSPDTPLFTTRPHPSATSTASSTPSWRAIIPSSSTSKSPSSEKLQQEIASRPRPPPKQPKAAAARPLPRPPPTPTLLPQAAASVASPVPLVSPEILRQLCSGDPAVVASILPPLPRPQRQPPKKPPKPREEYIADKSAWVMPERDLKMKQGFPPIWCLGRQELCETLPYFKAYQGGHYDLGEICHGYLLDGFGSALDRLEANGRIIISHGGGCAEGEGKNYRLKEDQRRDNVRVRALLNCQKTHTPVVLLAGSNYEHFPYLQTIGVRYCVLGYYFVRDVWVEAEPRVDAPGSYYTRFKFVFEWVSSQGKPWFESVIGAKWVGEPARTLPSSPADAEASSPIEGSRRLQSEQVYCAICASWSPHVFTEAISCYNESCSAFFTLPSGVQPNPIDLHYVDSFLLPLTATVWPSIVPLPLLPPSFEERAAEPADYSRTSWRGHYCSHCGRLSSRSDWRALACDACLGSVETLPPVYADAVELQEGAPRLDPVLLEGMGLVLTPVEGVEGWSGFTIQVGEGARIHHLWRRNETELEDKLFREYQGERAGKLFKRNTLSQHRLPGSYLCSQFSFNTGAEYNHVVNVETYPFDRPLGTQEVSSTPDDSLSAPSCVRGACEHLSDIAQLVCAEESKSQVGFNEVLSVAYMEGGKMAYHDDGEQGLGPIVATLSLGADATMSFRQKQRKKSRAKVPKEPEGEKPSTKPLVQLQLRHGDVTIMEGESVQRLLDHKVDPLGLRFAATARYISAQHKTRVATPASRTRGQVCPPGLHRGTSSTQAALSAPLQLPTPPKELGAEGDQTPPLAGSPTL